jgi:hypothetical protein
MKQIYIILMVILMTVTVQAGWKSLKSLSDYDPKDFTLKKDVIYVELRTFKKLTEMGEKIMVSKSTSVTLRIYRSTPKNKNIFSHIPLKEKYTLIKGEYVGMMSMSSWYTNGFMLDSAGKSWRLENVQDLIDIIKPIDTPAEVRLIMWLDPDIYSSEGDRYRKSGDGYIVKSHYVIHDSNQGAGCGDYSYQYKISRSGKITQKKLLRKKAVDICGSE